MLLAPLLFLALWYFTVVLLVVGHIFFLCSGHGGVDSLVTLMFWCIFPLLMLMVEFSVLDWEVSALFPWIPYLDPPLGLGTSDITPLKIYSSSSLEEIEGWEVYLCLGF